MSEIFTTHLQRLKAGASQATAVSETSRWIADNTFIRGKPYSYVNHEYQQRILDSTAQEVVVRKCSQVGISELAIRKALAMVGMVKNFTCIYTLPTATLASVISKTRVAPVIADSPYLRALASDVDNVEVKQLGNSYLYLRGCSAGSNISVPADFLVHDEIDFSDAQTLSGYQSRITHSPHKLKLKLSTPTLPGKGIDAEFQRSKRHFNFVKCNHCNHAFVVDYYEHIRIPGYTDDIRSITKRNLHSIDYRNAHVECPKCGKTPDLGPDYREWVCENPDENHVAEGFQVAPFDAPSIITPAYLVEASTQYSNIGDFANNNLGIPFFSQEAVLDPAEVQATITSTIFDGSQSFVMGIDVGMSCNIVIASCSWDGSMQVVHLEKVPMQRLRERYKELRLAFKVRMSVIDSLPYTDLVLALQAMDQNLLASVYSELKGVEFFQVKKRDEDDEKGLQRVRQINVNRNKTFDALMAFLRSGQFSKVTCGLDDEFVEHCTDMRRVKDWNMRTQEIQFKWVKSEQGDDHWWFALSYAFLAKHVIGTGATYGGSLPLLHTFRVKPAY